jgi:hypothetical protein
MEWRIQEFQDSDENKTDTEFDLSTVENKTYHPKVIRKKSWKNITSNAITTSLSITNNQRPNDCFRTYKFRYISNSSEEKWTEWKESEVPCEEIKEEINVKFGFIVGISIIWPVIVYLIGKDQEVSKL